MELPELTKYRGFNRLLLLFAPERSHPGYMSASQQIAGTGERLRDSDVRVLTVFSTGRVYEDDKRLEGADALGFRRRFGARRDGFTAVLLDLEGRETVRQEDELDLPSLFSAIRSETRH